MSIEPREKVGKGKILASIHNKCLISQRFRNLKTGKTYEWGIFGSDCSSSIVLPITKDWKVVAIRQFRHGADKVVLELPSGHIEVDKKETPIEAAKRELLEETGYQADRIIPLSPKEIFIDQSSYSTNYFGFLCLNCVRVKRPKLDENENIEVILIDLDDWIAMMYNNSNKANSNLAMTFLSLPHLGLFSSKKGAR